MSSCSKKLKPIKLDMTFVREHFKTSEKEEYSEPVIICRVFDIREQGMRAFEFSDGKEVLLVKQDGRIYAVSNRCTHSGGPLHMGVLGDRRVRCPWHGACFNLETGDIEDFPAWYSLTTYKVEIINNFWIGIRERVKDMDNDRGHVKEMVKYNPNNKTTFVIIGAGAAGSICAETLRQEGFTGRIIMVSKEDCMPYDRVKLSKSMELTYENIRIRDAEFYKSHDIVVHTGIYATKANMEEKTVLLSNDLELHFDKLFIATGNRSPRPTFKGNDLRNVFTLRTFEDWTNIKHTLEDNKNIVCLGTGFLCMEVAQSIRRFIKAHITIVSHASVPMEHVFGESIGRRLAQLYHENGINLIMKTTITEAIGNKYDDISSVILSDGTQLKCDILLIGVGNVPNTDFLIGSGLPVNANGTIEVDSQLQTLYNDVYAGGDIANCPVFAVHGQPNAISHYQIAQYHGHAAAINMIGHRYFDLRTVPFYSTSLFGYNFRYAGYGLYSYVIIEGNIRGLRFIAYYIDEQDRVVALTTCRCDPIASQFAELRNRGRILTRSDLVCINRPWYMRMNATADCKV